ncbi:glycosyltransferase [archaeon]|jgi:glycosyltransferase involved in cell wall biosynthesis|nr:glycosyltransferase [archaeon]
MKLVFFLENPYLIGGGDYAIFKFAYHLSQRGHKVTLFAKTRNNFFEDISNNNDNFCIKIRLSIENKFKGSGLINKIVDYFYIKFIVLKELKRIEPDFVIGYLRDSAIKVVKISEKFNIKSLNFVFESPPWMEKDLGHLWLEEYKGKFKESWQKTKEAYKKSDILISISEKSKMECESWINKKVDDIVYPGIDTNLFEDVKIQKKKNQLIYVGRLNIYKNVDKILFALKKIKNSPSLVIVGDGEEKKYLIKLSQKLGVKVNFKSNLNDFQKVQEIKTSLFMIFPSSHEGFGMPPMEALLCGIPCICSDKEIFKEIYKNKVIYFKENDIDDLTIKIKETIKLLKQNKYDTKSPKEYIKKRFEWKKSAIILEKILIDKIK